MALSMREGSALGRSLQETYANAASKPASGICAAISGVNHNNARASEVLGRLRAIADNVGGAHPASDRASEKNPSAMGYLGQINEANGVMSSVLGLIEEEVSRLEGLVG
ncbi:hypothetical protein OIU35_31645 [Boseaceae bacterium BT-24-1]|nr:hypothetical protein [Boseaceae bacterium BT-24-1]